MPRSILKSAITLLLAFASASSFCVNASAASADPAPVIESITPAVITASAQPQTVTVTGQGFSPNTSVQALWSPGRNTTNLVQSWTIVSSTKITLTIQCLPTAKKFLDVTVTNGQHAALAPAAITLQPQLSALTPIIFDETGDVPGADLRSITTVVRAAVTPHSTAYLVFDGFVPVPAMGYEYSGVSTASDDDGDGVVAFPSFASAPGDVRFIVVDSAGITHKGVAPFQTAMPDVNWLPPSPPHPERSADGTMSHYDLQTDPEALLMWVRPGIGAWFVNAKDHDSTTDADGLPFLDNRSIVRASVFQPVPGTLSGPPPAAFAPSDVVTIMSDPWWSIETLPSPLQGSSGGKIQILADFVLEGSPATFYLRRLYGSEGAVTIRYHTIDDTHAGVSYVATSGTVTFAPGEYVKTIVVQTLGDGIYGTPTLYFQLAFDADGASITPSQGTTINDAETPPVISINDVRVNEGDAPSATVQVPVTLTGRTLVPATMSWYTLDEAHKSGPRQTLTFAPGETVKLITIPYTGNTTAGPNRIITIHMELPVRAKLQSSDAFVTIVDDDSPQVSVDDIRAEEQSQMANFLVTMSRAVTTPVTVHYATFDGTATAPLDYEATSGTLTFAPGEIAKTVTVPIVRDQIADPEETFTLRLSDAAEATIAKSSGTATILESDRLPQPVVLIDDIAVAEGNSGTTDATFNVRLSFASSLPVVVAWKTENGSAHDDSDYLAGIGTLTFAPGETSLPVTVKISADTTPEPNETFHLAIIGTSNAIAGNGAACTIINDDGQPPPSRRRAAR